EKIRTDAAGMVEDSATVCSQETRDLPSHRTVTRVETIEDKGSQTRKYNEPKELTTNDKGELVVADWKKERVQILDWTGHCRICLSFKSFGKQIKPCGVAVSRDGKYYIIDRSNHQIVVCGEDNTIITTFRHYYKSIRLSAIALTMNEYVLVTDWHKHCLSKYTVDGIYVADLGEEGEGACQFKPLKSVVVNSKNQIIVSDGSNHRIQVFDSQFRFLYSRGSTRDNQLLDPWGVDVDSQDNIY
ncbi:uncharacterized protein LOC102808065, partial [Saccoglossus kowalevskii]|uniref:RING finger protein nhl-1-like n=1 Tax=Saccoglossus kowalevskii TaxID=10224 RepID=A0ABM0MHN3_SACKO